MRLFVALCALVLMAPPALAQVPQDIPDGTGRDLGEEQKERRMEAFREDLQHLYLATQLGAGPAFGVPRHLTIGAHQAVGVQLDAGHVLAVAFDVYRMPAERDSNPFAQIGLYDESVAVVTIQYHHNLRRLAPRSEHARRTTVAFGYGVATGGNQGMTATLTPTYTLPVNRYWSMPLGVQFSHLLLDGSTSVAQRTFLGLQIGVRLHPFGHRDRLE